MSRYHAAAIAFDREAGFKDLVKQLSELLGAGVKAAADAARAVKKLGVDAVRKLLSTLGDAVSGMASSTRSRFAAAVIAVALMSGAAAADDVIIATVHFDTGISYIEYRATPHVVRLYSAGFTETDIISLFVHFGGHYDVHEHHDRGHHYDRGHHEHHDRGHRHHDDHHDRNIRLRFRPPPRREAPRWEAPSRREAPVRQLQRTRQQQETPRQFQRTRQRQETTRGETPRRVRVRDRGQQQQETPRRLRRTRTRGG